MRYQVKASDSTKFDQLQIVLKQKSISVIAESSSNHAVLVGIKEDVRSKLEGLGYKLTISTELDGES
jgi:hypothetical protein